MFAGLLLESFLIHLLTTVGSVESHENDQVCGMIVRTTKLMMKREAPLMEPSTVTPSSVDSHNQSNSELSDSPESSEELSGSTEYDDETIDENRVLAGVKVDSKRYPWMVLLRRQIDNDWTCGASLLTKKHVLTAAHCLFSKVGRNITDMEALIGFTNRKDVPIEGRRVIIAMSNATVHEKYSNLDKQKNYDVAIIQLKEEIPQVMFNKKFAGIACLPEIDEKLESRLLVIGWGNNGSEDGKPQDALMEASISGTQLGDCPENAHCLANLPADACGGDSGGPLVQMDSKGRMKVIGIVSHGQSCSDRNRKAAAGVYADIRKHLQWIRRQIDQT